MSSTIRKSDGKREAAADISIQMASANASGLRRKKFIMITS